MNCPKCKSKDAITGVLTFGFTLPLMKGGGVQPPPVTVATMKQLWQQGLEKRTAKIECNSCGQMFDYIAGKGLVPCAD